MRKNGIKFFKGECIREQVLTNYVYRGSSYCNYIFDREVS
jgi:hypothetical protein